MNQTRKLNRDSTVCICFACQRLMLASDLVFVSRCIFSCTLEDWGFMAPNCLCFLLPSQMVFIG